MSEEKINHALPFRDLPVAAYQLDRNGQLVAVTPAFARVLGYTDETACLAALTGSADLWYAETGRRQALFEDLGRSGRIDNKASHINRFGFSTPIVISETGRGFMDQDNQIDGYQVHVEKVTDASETQDRLDLIESRLNTLTEFSTEWLWETDAEQRFTWFSQSVEKFTGVPREWHYGKRRDDIGLEDGQDGWAEHRNVLQRREAFHDFRYRRKGPNKTDWLTASGVPVFDANGSFIGYRGIGRDITYEVETSRVNDEVFEAIDDFEDALSIWDADDRLIMRNRAFRTMNAQVPDGIALGTTFSEHIRLGLAAGSYPIAEKDPDAWFEARMNSHITGDDVVEFERQDGRWIMVRDFKLSGGGTMTLATNITARRELESTLRLAREMAERANYSKSMFLANMSHELRTPLNAVIGYSEAMSSGMFRASGVTRYEEFAGSIEESAKHLLNLINDILDISRIEAGALELEEEALDLKTLIEQVALIVRPRAAEASVAFDIQVDLGLPSLFADGRSIKQILINLLSNSVKFTKPGGLVSISAKSESDGGLRLVVADTGIGIAAEQLEEIWQPFTQVGSSYVQAHEGTGLGLSIVRNLVRMHDGRIDIESAPGAGTRITIRFGADRMRSENTHTADTP